MQAADTQPDAPPPTPPKPKKSFRKGCIYAFSILLTVPLLFAMAAVGGWFWLIKWGERPYGTPGAHQVRIAPKTGADQIAHQLADAGLLENPTLFLVWKRLHHAKASLQAGDFLLQGPIAPEQLVEKLGHGQFGKAVTIPEGWTTKQIAARLRKLGFIPDEQAWLTAVSQPIHILKSDQPSAEGFCFPDTYRFETGTSVTAIRDTMLTRFAEKWAAAKPDQRTPETTSATLRDVVILASMLEREARVDDEMPLMASVYYNRLQRKMKLQCCATVYYALALAYGQQVWNTPLTLADLRTDSPYNTYQNFGLPPGPISNPGLPALQAALRPDVSAFLFYVYRGDNHHIFSRTWADHEAAIITVKAHNPQAALVAQNQGVAPKQK